MKLIEKLTSVEKNFSIEITPPFKNKSISPFFRTIERFIPHNPAFVSITYHPLKTSCIQTEKKSFIIKKHADHLGICAAVKYKYNVVVLPHFVCAGMNHVEVEDRLIDYAFLGIENLLVLRGDALRANEEFTPVDGGYAFANELVFQLNEMRQALYLNKIDDYPALDFCIGVAGYPEKHFQARDQQTDIDYLKRKIDSGADFIITQLCYNLEQFIDWVNLCRRTGIKVPIIPGFKPLTSMQQILTLKQVYQIKIPESIEKIINQASEKNRAWEIGIEHGANFCRRLQDFGFPFLHFYTMGNGKDIEELVKRIKE